MYAAPIVRAIPNMIPKNMRIRAPCYDSLPEDWAIELLLPRPVKRAALLIVLQSDNPFRRRDRDLG